LRIQTTAIGTGIVVEQQRICEKEFDLLRYDIEMRLHSVQLKVNLWEWGLEFRVFGTISLHYSQPHTKNLAFMSLLGPQQLLGLWSRF
jgi:hypothetical protein